MKRFTLHQKIFYIFLQNLLRPLSLYTTIRDRTLCSIFFLYKNLIAVRIKTSSVLNYNFIDSENPLLTQ